MCLIVFANNVHKNYKLVFAANRDEFYDRPTVQAAFWEKHPFLLAGKDLQAGGTWMGITKSGRFAAITNYRDLKSFNKNAPTRGMLTCNYLTEESEPQDYFQSIKQNLDNYNGFNLLIGNQDRLFYISNIKKQFAEIKPGIHGLSNSFLDTPWEKVEKSKQRLNEIIKSEKINATDLMSLLNDTDYAQEKNLPDTGIGLKLERVLSSVFIKSEKYGTRCSTVLLIDRNNNIYFSEKTYLPYENRFITKDYKFSIESR